MNRNLFDDFRTRQGTDQQVEADRIIFEQRNPLDERLLREIETELAAITGCAKKDRVKLTVLSLSDFEALKKNPDIVPKRLLDRGLGPHLRTIVNPKNPHEIFVGPAALSALNDGQSTATTDLVYQMIEAFGQGSNLAFDRGVSDILAKAVAERLDLDIFTDMHPGERKFVEAMIEAAKPNPDDDPVELAGMLRRDPKTFFATVKASPFFQWWEGSAKADDRLARFADLIASISSPNAQWEGSFMAWAEACAERFSDYRAQQRRNALAGAAKRAESTA